MLGIQRELLLSLQWLDLPHHPSDLLLLLSDEGGPYNKDTGLYNKDAGPYNKEGGLYSKVVALSAVVSSQPSVLPGLSPTLSSRLGSRLRMACVTAMQLLALRVR